MILNLTKKRIARRFQKKDPEAIAWIHNYYYAFVYKVVEKMIGYPPDMSEVVDVVFMELPEAAARLDNLEKIRDFLYLTARTTCLDYMKREKWRESEHVKYFYHNLNTRQREQLCIHLQFDYLMNEAASRLSHRKQEVLRLFYFDAPVEEVACREIQLSERKAQNLKIEALKKLKLHIGKSEDYQYY